VPELAADTKDQLNFTLMKYALSFIFIIVTCFKLAAQQVEHPIDLKQLDEHINDTTRICAWIMNIKRLNKEVEITLGNKFSESNEVLVVIKQETLLMTKYKDELKIGDYLCIDGVLVKHDNAFFINILKPAQFHIVTEDDFKPGE
jgi:hypothetical protein